MTIELTPQEVIDISSPKQHFRYYLTQWTPGVVFSAQINQSFSTLDSVVEVEYDNVSFGVYTDIESDLTVYIGSAAGMRDVGVCRIRKAATSNKIYIGETSEIRFADNLHITVVDTVIPNEKHNRIVNDVVYSDWDIPYTDQNVNFTPRAIMGATLVPLLRSGSTVSYSPPNASRSSCVGSSVSGFFWSCSGAYSITGETTATPTFEFNTVGQYVIKLKLTAANGKTSLSYRYVVVHGSGNEPLEIESATLSSNKSGWQLSVSTLDDVSSVDVNAMSVFWQKGYVGGVEKVIGQQEENEHILFSGWVDQETVVVNKEQSSTTFSIYSADYWMRKIQSYPSGLRNVSIASGNWSEVQNLTLDKAFDCILRWHSTFLLICDTYFTENELVTPFIDNNGGDLFSILQNISNDQLLANVMCDRYNSIRIFVDPQYLLESERTAIPVVFSITDSNIVGELEIIRDTTNEFSLVDLSGISYNGSIGTPILSKSFGNVYGARGKPFSKNNLLLESQEAANALSSLIMSRGNLPYKKIRAVISTGFPVLSISQPQYILFSIDTANNRDVSINDYRFVPKKITLNINSENGSSYTTVEFEQETKEGNSVTYVRPQTPIDNFPPLPDFSVEDFPILPFDIFSSTDTDYIPKDPDISTDEACRENTDAAANGDFLLWVRGTQVSNEKENLYGWMRCYIRSSAHTNKTKIIINGTWQKKDNKNNWIDDETDDSWYNVYAIGSYGERVATATKENITTPSSRTFTFSPPASTQIVGFEFALDLDTADAMTTVMYVENGTITSNNDYQLDSGHAMLSTMRSTYVAHYIFSLMRVKFYTDHKSGYWDVTAWGKLLGRLRQSALGESYPGVIKLQFYGGSHPRIKQFDNVIRTDGDGWITAEATQTVEATDWITFDWSAKGTVPNETDYFMRVTVKRSAQHRIVYNNVLVYNICPISEVIE